MRKRVGGFSLALISILGLVTGTAAVGTTVVKAVDVTAAAPPVTDKTWYEADTRSGGDNSFVSGPGTAPLGSGSLRQTTDSAIGGSGNAKVQLFNYAAFGTDLDLLDTLTFQGYRSSASTTGAAPHLSLNVAVYANGGTSGFTTLVYEPVYQAGGAGAITNDTWQAWDALQSGAGIWWSTQPITGVCANACYVPWTTITSNNPNAAIIGIAFNVGSGITGQFTGYADALTVGIGGATTTFDFEPTPQCTTTCYVDDGGNDLNGGTSPADAKKTIQAAIDQVDAGGTVRVLPGTYSETATNRTVTGAGGPHQFGLFFDDVKPGVTVMGVTGTDTPIADAGATQATVTTNATNNFGFSGIFVEAAGTTIQGLEIGPNAAGDNKTIEVIGDDFTLQYVTTSIPGGGSVYINDFSTLGDVVKAYHVLDNAFLDGTSVDIASGAGNTGPVADRVISDNAFDLQDNGFNAISFSGSGGVPWYTLPVGGATITGNSFEASSQYIRARGVYHEAQFDWESFWTDNDFPDGAAVALEDEPTFDVRSWSYTSGPYTFTNVRRIGGTIQGEVGNAAAVVGDTVLVREGTYPEDVVVNKSNLTLKGAGVDVSTIVGTKGDTSRNTVEIPASAPDVTVEGFTITRAGNTVADWNDANGNLNNQGVAIYSTGSTLRDSKLTGNRNALFLYGATNVSVLNNDIDFNRTGIHLVNDVSGLVVRNNFITDNWTMGILLRDESSPNATGTVTIKDNHIAGNWYSQVEARSLFSAPNLDVTGNWLGTIAPTVFPAPDSAEPGYSAQIPVAYGGSDTPPGGTPTVIYNPVNASNPVDYDPWLCTGTDAAPVTIGFQPVSGALSPCAGPMVSNVVASPNPAPINTTVTITALVDDSTTGGATIASAEYSIDGGAWNPMTAADGTFDEISEAVQATRPSGTVVDVFTLCVRGTDAAGLVGASECITFIVYDPSGGFVTGGGWINSPAGAFPADPGLTGKATFGLVSKYKKGASIPDGNAQFAFSAGDLSFSSTSYQWLVVNQGGTNAQFKGVGTINGAGSYQFMIWATDGSPDKFRIKITDGSTVIYDNLTETALGGGSIIVHKK